MTDIEIAQAAKPEHITEIARRAGIDDKYLELYGSNKAKVSLDLCRELEGKSERQAGSCNGDYSDSCG